MKSEKMDLNKGRSLVWVLSQQRGMLEAQTLERLEARLDEVSGHARSSQKQLGSETRPPH